MYSLITKIAHSTAIKDALGIARGIFRVVSHTTNEQNRAHWEENIQQHQSTRNTEELVIKNTAPLSIKDNINESTNLVSSKTPQVAINAEQQQSMKSHQNTYQKKIILEQKTLIAAQELSILAKENEAEQFKQRTQSKVISSRFGRIFEYGKLGRWMLETQVEAYVARNLGKGNQQEIYERGANKITEQLCKMRGAPLKVAQMLSIQEDNLIPAPIRKAFEKAREQAHVMPEQQVKETLQSYLGNEWQNKFKQFELKPFAAASIGQVHRATSLQGEQLAVKIQYPGVQKSIQSDIKNLKMLLKLPGVLPKGIFIDKLLANTEKQLKQECDYERQAKMHTLYDKCLREVMGKEYDRYAVPKINSQLSQKSLLASQFLRGIRVSRFQEENIPQSIRDEVGRLLMKLTFSQIFEMGIMQSDPNPSNFTYNTQKNQLNLYDFGATHIYNQQFLAHYCRIIDASVRQDKEEIIKESILTGFLTNEENSVMLENHVESILILGEPMRENGVYDFGNQSITDKIYKTIPKMLKNRLKSPPEEVYSLHRKLSGSYLACIRMKSRVNCNKIFSQLKPAYKIKELL